MEQRLELVDVVISSPFGQRPAWTRETILPIELRRGEWLYLIGGPTGYESFSLASYLANDTGLDWCACAGFSDWNRCVVKAASLRAALGRLGLLNPEDY